MWVFIIWANYSFLSFVFEEINSFRITFAIIFKS